MKKILISPKVISNPNYYEINNILDFEYVRLFEELGYQVIIVPNNSSNIEQYFDLEGIKMIVLSGGNNVNPDLYNSSDHLEDVYSVRDEAETRLINESIKRDIPLFGICRGFHMINVFFGGILLHGIKNHVRMDHKIKSNNIILNNVITNTYHNQGLTSFELGQDLVSIAESNDGFIEAIKHNKYKILGVQWHPERQNNDFDKELIKSFLKGEV